MILSNNNNTLSSHQRFRFILNQDNLEGIQMLQVLNILPGMKLEHNDTEEIHLAERPMKGEEVKI